MAGGHPHEGVKVVVGNFFLLRYLIGAYVVQVVDGYGGVFWYDTGHTLGCCHLLFNLQPGLIEGVGGELA